jgi:N-methylhydantoinase A
VVALVAGRLRVLKVPSTPHDPAEAVRRALRAVTGGGRVAALHYGSTVATNALVERRGARVVLLATAGFEDVLEIGRQARPILYALEPRPPAPLVGRAQRIGVPERVLADGRVERRLARAAAARAAAAVVRQRPQAVAVCLLHSYANPVHERLLGRALQGRGLHLTLSHRLLREYREYERTATVVANAYVGPLVSGHLRALARGLGGRLRVMQSNGGLAAARTAAAEPVRTVLSGPAAGVVGATVRARRAGFRRLVTLDMGGTSTDVSVVDGRLGERAEAVVEGLPIRVPALDIHTVGAGGGSLVRIDAGGALRVGPESAGAEPGPACYGRGSAPTVTDAHLVLGRLVEDEFLGGAFPLSAARARQALVPIARRLGGSLTAAAEGVVHVATAVMARAVRVLTVERGRDPRDFTLVAFGGAGGLHAAELAAALGIPRVYLPSHPGLLSAWGVLGAEVRRDFSRTFRAVDPAPAQLAAGFRALAHAARAALVREGIARPRLERFVDARYVGQGYEVTVPWTAGWRRAFHARHRRLFGHAAPTRPIEVVTLRLRVRGDALPLPPQRPRAPARPAVPAQRRVVFSGRAHVTAVYRRDTLGPGACIRGPAIVCEYSATTVVPPGWQGEVDRHGGLVLEAACG